MTLRSDAFCGLGKYPLAVPEAFTLAAVNTTAIAFAAAGGLYQAPMFAVVSAAV